MVFLRSAMQIAVGATALVMGQVVVAEQHDSQAAQDKIVHLNQIQVIGSHNSYHAGFAPSERKYLEMKNPKTLRGLGLPSCAIGGSAFRWRKTS